MRRLILTGSLLLALSTTAMAGQVYKWVDAQGNTHFGSQPPEGQQATSINTNVATPKTPAPAAAKPAAAVAETDEQKAIDSKVKEDVAKQEAERKQYCDTVRTNLSQLQNNPRVRGEIFERWRAQAMPTLAEHLFRIAGGDGGESVTPEDERIALELLTRNEFGFWTSFIAQTQRALPFGPYAFVPLQILAFIIFLAVLRAALAYEATFRPHHRPERLSKRANAEGYGNAAR